MGSNKKTQNNKSESPMVGESSASIDEMWVDGLFYTVPNGSDDLVNSDNEHSERWQEYEQTFLDEESHDGHLSFLDDEDWPCFPAELPPE